MSKYIALLHIKLIPTNSSHYLFHEANRTRFWRLYFHILAHILVTFLPKIVLKINFYLFTGNRNFQVWSSILQGHDVKVLVP